MKHLCRVAKEKNRENVHRARSTASACCVKGEVQECHANIDPEPANQAVVQPVTLAQPSLGLPAGRR